MRGGAAFRASARRAHWLPPRWAEGRARAALGPFPYAEHRTLAEVDALPESVVFTPERMALGVSTSLDTNGSKEAKPRITSGATEEIKEALPLPASQGAAVAEPVTEASPLYDPTPAPQSEQAGPRITSGVTEEIKEPSPLPAPRQRVKRPAVELDTPPASPPATPKPIPRAERLALPPVSGMEQLFTPKQGGPLAGALGDLAAVDDSKTYCAPCDHRVPRWFGRDCITANCPLKVSA